LSGANGAAVGDENAEQNLPGFFCFRLHQRRCPYLKVARIWSTAKIQNFERWRVGERKRLSLSLLSLLTKCRCHHPSPNSCYLCCSSLVRYYHPTKNPSYRALSTFNLRHEYFQLCMIKLLLLIRFVNFRSTGGCFIGPAVFLLYIYISTVLVQCTLIHSSKLALRSFHKN
jgi:hypothetical protein